MKFTHDVLDYLFSLAMDSKENPMQKAGMMQLVAAMSEVEQEEMKAQKKTEFDLSGGKKTFRVVPGDSSYPNYNSAPYNKILTIKLIRGITGVGLKEAKDMSEQDFFTLPLTAAQVQSFKNTGCTVQEVESGQVKPETINRSCYLVFREDSKSVKVTSGLKCDEGEVVVRVNANIPKSLFTPRVINATVDLQEDAPISDEALVDLQTAIGMGYGGVVQLVVSPAAEKQNATSLEESPF